MMMMDNEVMSGIWTSWKKHAYGKRTLCFASGVEHSLHIKRLFESHGIAAGHIDGKTKKRERERILRDFAEGRITYLTNVGVLTEGYDNPAIECVQLARPTKSYGLYNQMVGRGARPFKGKDHYILLDHGNNVMEHSIPEDEPEWSLTKGAIKKKDDDQKSYTVKVGQGENEQILVVTSQQLPLMRDDIQVVEIDTTFRAKEIDDCIQFAQKRNYKLGHAYFNFVTALQRSGDKPSLPELHYFKKKLGYDGRWVKYKCKDLGIKTL
jgi:superfamily II DNA or RNA helicase